MGIFLSEISTANRNFRLNWQNPLKSAQFMLMIGPYQESQMRLDDQTKQDSLSWMSKLFVKKRIIGIGLELVIFIKKTLNGDESIFVSTSLKRLHIIRETKNSSFSSVVVLTKTGRSFTIEPTRELPLFSCLKLFSAFNGLTKTTSPC